MKKSLNPRSLISLGNQAVNPCDLVDYRNNDVE